MKSVLRLTAVAAACFAAISLQAAPASAFCGFYVGGGGAKLFNNATQVVLMREGTRTVISMQNNYEGPPANFAMVVPVPVVLSEATVKTLPRELFTKIDALDSPRLVEYWEQDPCPPPAPPRRYRPGGPPRPTSRAAMEDGDEAPTKRKDLGVRIEAKFVVGEYDIVILSAKDSTGLDTWLRQENYTIPEGAEPYLRPYVQSGSKFFVAKVDPSKVKFESGMAALSPLRFHYDAENFNLPVRLGLMNAKGPQDLVVHILARGQRYEVTNYPNVSIPTNFDVTESAKQNFGGFYAALFDETTKRHPGAVVTEYSWDAQSCDPCPVTPLGQQELQVLGGDVLGASLDYHSSSNGGFTITRLHARYTKDSLGDDLHFRAAKPITGGRELMSSAGKLEQGSKYDATNNFQGRYSVRHPWTGPIACKNPVRGVWGGPPGGRTEAPAVKPVHDVAFVTRGLPLPPFVAGGQSRVPDGNLLGAAAPTPALGRVFPFVTASSPDAGSSDAPSSDDGGPSDTTSGGAAGTPPGPRGCGGCAEGGGNAGALGASFAILAAALRRRFRRRNAP